MIRRFEDRTKPLSDYEEYELKPMVVKCLGRKIGEHNKISNPKMCQALKEYGYEVDQVRMRRVIRNIRDNQLIPYLIADSRGYYVADDEDDFKDYLLSLKERIDTYLALQDEMTAQYEMFLEERRRKGLDEDTYSGGSETIVS